MTGRPTRYLLPAGMSATELRDRLAPHLELEEDGRRRTERTLLDSFDARLRDSGHELVHEAGRLVLLDDEGEVASTERRAASAPVFVAELPAGRLRDRLDPILEMRAATPVARLRLDRRDLRVLDAERKTVVRLAIVEASAGPAGRGAPRPLAAHVELAGVRGYDKPLRRARKALEEELGLTAAPESLYDEAVVAAGGSPEGFSSKLAIELAPGDRADAAAATVLRRLQEIIDANLPGTLADTDTEFLHDFRVAVRRTRALQRELKAVFPPERLASFRAQFRRLQQVTGPTRDLDVQLLEFDEVAAHVPDDRRADLEPLRAVLEAHRRREFGRMGRALRSKATRETLSGWRSLIDELETLPTDDRPDAVRPIGDVAAGRIAKVYRTMVEMGGRIDDHSPAEDLHDLRKKGKELRYLLEFFSALFPSETATPMVKTLKALQDTLGRFQDREVQAHVLRDLGDEITALDDGAPTLMAMGLLAGRLEQQQEDARAEFAERFAPFAAKQRQAAVKETFG